MNFIRLFIAHASLLSCALVLSAHVSMAADAPNVYRATNDSQNTGSQEFNTVEAEGIRAVVMAQALQKCYDAGKSLCSVSEVQLIGSNVLSDGFRHVSYEAVVQALDGQKLVAGAIFPSTRSTWSVKAIPYLNSMASQAMAIETAQSQCYATGATVCVITSTNFTEVSGLHSDDNRYHTSANATAQAYLLP